MVRRDVKLRERHERAQEELENISMFPLSQDLIPIFILN